MRYFPFCSPIFLSGQSLVSLLPLFFPLSVSVSSYDASVPLIFSSALSLASQSHVSSPPFFSFKLVVASTSSFLLSALCFSLLFPLPSSPFAIRSLLVPPLPFFQRQVFPLLFWFKVVAAYFHILLTFPSLFPFPCFSASLFLPFLLRITCLPSCLLASSLTQPCVRKSGKGSLKRASKRR